MRCGAVIKGYEKSKAIESGVNTIIRTMNRENIKHQLHTTTSNMCSPNLSGSTRK